MFNFQNRMIVLTDNRPIPKLLFDEKDLLKCWRASRRNVMPHRTKEQNDASRDEFNEWLTYFKNRYKVQRSEEFKDARRESAKFTRFFKTEIKEINCEFCGIQFTKNNSVKRFCSPFCREKAKRFRLDTEVTKECEFCEKPFKKNRYSKLRFCSSLCSNSSRRKDAKQKKEQLLLEHKQQAILKENRVNDFIGLGKN